MKTGTDSDGLSLWWRRGAILVIVLGFALLIFLTAKSYYTAPPIPEKAVLAEGQVVFTKEDVQAGQGVFLKYGLMDNGTIWGHGAYLGPDFSASYLHNLSVDAQQSLAESSFQKPYDALTLPEQQAVQLQVTDLLKENRYDPESGVLILTAAEAASFQRQIQVWTDYFASTTSSSGLKQNLISHPEEIKQLTAFFAWSAWASVAQRPDKPYSYTNNFPYDPSVGNTATADTVLWSALSLIALLGGLGLVLFVVGRWNFLGWRGKQEGELEEPKPIASEIATPAQRATIKYFAVVVLLLLLQVAMGALVAHYRADPSTFYGLDLSKILPSNLDRSWHLQIAVFWIATSYVAGALFLAPILSKKDPKHQVAGINILFGALVLVVAGSLIGEWLGINNKMGNLWFWLGHQGWEYLELGRIWQILLAIGLLLWLFLLVRALKNASQNPDFKQMASLFIITAIGIPIFYVPAMFINSMTNYAVVETWRFWIIHLWVEGFFELFATVMVAIIFFVLGVTSKKTSIRVIYLDAILYLAGGIVGTGHHWYWTGQSNLPIALSSVFSALEVVPLTLLTLDAWDFIKISQGKWEIVKRHKWTFYFLMAVGFWNFLGAGVFGFLINLPIVSYYEVGTTLTPNHGHTSFMGVFGMLSLALIVFGLRQVLDDQKWKKVDKFVGVGFWGLNIGLLLMSLLSLFPGGVLQLLDVLKNGYWHARSQAYMGQPLVKTIEWIRMGPDLIFVLAGCIPLAIAVLFTLWQVVKHKKSADANH